MPHAAARERETYEALWATVEAYGVHSPGLDRVPMFLELAAPAPGALVLDAGAGSGQGALALAAHGLRVVQCDLTAEGLTPEAAALPFVEAVLWDDLAPIARLVDAPRFDFVYCCDVLEHVPTEYTMLVLRRLLDVSAQGVFLSIALVPDQFGVWAGRPLHQTVQPFTWWRDHVRELAELVECRDLLTSGVYWARARR